MPVSRRRQLPAKRVADALSSEGSSSEEEQEEEEPTTKRRGAAPAKPRGRGRPRGAKRTFPAGRGSRAAAAATTPKASPSPAQNGTSTTPRATRATVTLPPGYIEGVKGARWPKPRAGRDDSVNGAATDDDSKGKKVTKGKGKGKAKEKEEEDIEEPELEVKDEVEEKPEVLEVVAAMEIDEPAASTSRETTALLEAVPTPTPTPEPVAAAGKPEKVEKGKKGKKGKEKAVELPERAACESTSACSSSELTDHPHLQPSDARWTTRTSSEWPPAQQLASSSWSNSRRRQISLTTANTSSSTRLFASSPPRRTVASKISLARFRTRSGNTSVGGTRAPSRRGGSGQ